MVAATLATMTDAADELTDEHRAILEFERGWFKYNGAKEGRIRERFGMSPTEFYAKLNWVIDQPAALEYDPILVRRLRRMRDARAAARRGAAYGAASRPTGN